jgi:hypothetical protein
MLYFLYIKRTKGDKMKAYRQTTIWEFMNKKTLRNIDKFKVMYKLSLMHLNMNCNENWILIHDRIHKLFMNFFWKLSKVQYKYYKLCQSRYLNNQISLCTFENNMKLFFNYYKA